MLKSIFYMILMIFLLLVTGGYILSQFPQLQPLWDEMKNQAVNLYHLSVGKIGETGTVLLIIAVIVLIGTSARHIR